MKKKITLILAILFYRVVFGKITASHLKLSYKKWHFKMKARKWVAIPLLIIFSPIIIILVGFLGLPEVWKNILKTQDWSSYELHLPEGEKPKLLECYKRF